MPPVDALNALGGRVRGDLDALSDFLGRSKTVWEAFEVITTSTGHPTTYTNPNTGSTVNQDDLIRLAPAYLDLFLLPFCFQRLVAIFEAFVFDFLRVLLTHNPHRLARKQVPFEVVLAAADRDAIVQHVVDRELNELKYARVREWFEYLETALHVGRPTPDEVEALAELKASRDVLEHNAGVANATYLAKAGPRARARAGDRIEITDAYFQQSWSLVRAVADAVLAAAQARLAP